jgi:cell division protein FtsB
MTDRLDIKRKARFRRAIYAKPTILLLLLVLGFALHGTWGMYQKHAVAKEHLERSKATLGDLQLREAELERDTQLLASPSGIEAEIRERFMVAKEGEGVIIISDPKEVEVHTVTISEPESL